MVAAYRAEHPDNLKPKETTLSTYDQNLFDTYEAEIQRQAPDRGIAPNDFNRSMLVLFAVQSTAVKVSTRVDHACTYLLAVST
jgi:hypothetical protein